MRVGLEPSPDVEGSWVVADVGLAYGGVAPKSIMASQVREGDGDGEGEREGGLSCLSPACMYAASDLETPVSRTSQHV
jgi:hypothetical protein